MVRQTTMPITRNIDPTYGKCVVQYIKRRDFIRCVAGGTDYFFSGTTNSFNIFSVLSSTADFTRLSDSFAAAQLIDFSISLTRITQEASLPSIYLAFFPAEYSVVSTARVLNQETAQIVSSHIYNINTKRYAIKPLQVSVLVDGSPRVYNPALPTAVGDFSLLPGCMTVANPGNIVFGPSAILYQVDMAFRVRFLCPV